MNTCYTKILIPIIGTFLCFIFGGCEIQRSVDWDPSTYARIDKTMNAYDLILSIEKDNPGTFKNLITILDTTGLDTLYSNPSTRTFFAPTDIAINDFLTVASNKNYNWEKIEDVPVPLLTKLILTHTINGKKFLSTSPEVTENAEDLVVTSMNNTTLSIYRLEDYRFRYVGEFTVTVKNSNFEPTNGALHIIDVLAVKDAMRFDDDF